MPRISSFLIVSNLLLVTILGYTNYTNTKIDSIYKYKCPESQTHIQSTHINTITKEVSCTYYPPTRKSTTSTIK
jgi:hypothetical protein